MLQGRIFERTNLAANLAMFSDPGHCTCATQSITPTRSTYLYISIYYILLFTVLCRAPSFHWSILNNEIHLSGSRLYGMVNGMADSYLYNTPFAVHLRKIYNHLRQQLKL